MKTLGYYTIVLLILSAPVAVNAAEPAIAEAQAGSWQALDEAFGRVSARAESRIQLPFPVRLTRVAVAPGQPVAAGAELLRFEAPRLLEETASYHSARQVAALAARRLALLRRNEREHTVTRRDRLAGEQAVAQARAQADRAWERLQADLSVLDSNGPGRHRLDRLLDDEGVTALAGSLGILRAPFAGVVVRRPPPAGVWVEANTPLVDLEDLSQIYVTAGVPEQALADWRQGESQVEKGGFTIPLTPLPGAPGIDPKSGLRLLRYRADNPDSLMQDGEWLRVAHRSPARPVVWVPEATVMARNGKAWCLVEENGGSRPVQVRAGPAERGRVPVLAGLRPGQKVVTEGAYELLYRDLKDLIKFVD